MAKVVETVERDGHKIAIYESGAQYDVCCGKLAGAPKHAQFTRETALVAVERRAELKREAVARGAAKILERSGEWEAPNDIDVAEALGEAVMLKALNPDNPKQVDAARFILQETGMAESQTSSNASPSNFAAASAFGSELARQFAQIVSDVLTAQSQAQDQPPAGPVVDGEMHDVHD